MAECMYNEVYNGYMADCILMEFITQGRVSVQWNSSWSQDRVHVVMERMMRGPKCLLCLRITQLRAHIKDYWSNVINDNSREVL